jgi:hypothetical protein
MFPTRLPERLPTPQASPRKIEIIAELAALTPPREYNRTANDFE